MVNGRSKMAHWAVTGFPVGWVFVEDHRSTGYPVLLRDPPRPYPVRQPFRDLNVINKPAWRCRLGKVAPATSANAQSRTQSPDLEDALDVPTMAEVTEKKAPWRPLGE